MIRCNGCGQTIAQVEQMSSTRVWFYTVQGKVFCPNCMKRFMGVEAQSLPQLLRTIQNARAKKANRCS
jgi:hypothetical protein